MDASIVVVTKDQKEFLKQTILTLKNQIYKGSYEIIVVDSGSRDGALDFCKKEKITLVNKSSKNFNYADAFNQGARKAKGRFLVRLSGDAIPIDKNFLQEILLPFSDPKVGVTFGKYIISGKKGYGYPNFWPEWRFPKELKRYVVKPTFLMGAEIFFFSFGKNMFEFAGGCCAIRRSIWEKRGFNEKLTAGEDAEYAWFLHLIGYDIVCNPRAEVLHEHKINLVKTTRKYLGFEKWNFEFKLNIWKHWLRRIIVGVDPYKGMHYKAS
jgi:rhamnosyltransferase